MNKHEALIAAHRWLDNMADDPTSTLVSINIEVGIFEQEPQDGFKRFETTGMQTLTVIVQNPVGTVLHKDIPYALLTKNRSESS